MSSFAHWGGVRLKHHQWLISVFKLELSFGYLLGIVITTACKYHHHQNQQQQKEHIFP